MIVVVEGSEDVGMGSRVAAQSEVRLKGNWAEWGALNTGVLVR